MRYLVRHAEAAPGRPDDGRMLTERGEVQARGLVVRCALVTSVWVSPAQRCRQTVAPLERRHGLVVGIDPRLGEGMGPTGALVRLGACDRALVCTHGDVVGEVVRLLALRGVRIDGPSSCAPAGLWSLECSDDLTSGWARYSAP